MKDVLKTFIRRPVLGNFSDAEAEEIMDEIAEMYEVDGLDHNGKLALVYVRLRFAAVLPAQN